jgi:hypothetical protein
MAGEETKTNKESALSPAWLREKERHMSNMVLQCKDSGDFKPHPEGIHPAVCLDVIDLGLQETEFQGQRRLVNKLKVVFESELRMEDGKPFTISKNFTASLHPKARLAEFIGKWRGRPVVPGESIDLAKLIGACCTLVVSHQQNMVGRTYASIDAVSKPTKKILPSGTYDRAAVRQRIAEWTAKQQGASGQWPVASGRRADTSPRPSPLSGEAVRPKSAGPEPEPAPAFDPEVGF